MKKVIMGIIIGAVGMLGITTFADTINVFTAQKATFPVLVNGEEFQSDKPIVAIDGSTYLPLKATGEALGVEVNWNPEERRVEIEQMSTESTPVIEKTAEPEPILEVVETKPTPTTTDSVEKFGSNKKVYNLKSDLVLRLNKETIITYNGDQYIAASIFGHIQNIDGDLYIALPGKEPVMVKTKTSQPTEDSYVYNDITYIKLSSLGLTARIEGDTAWIE